MLNEAALLTARSNEKLITDAALDEAIDRVIAGPQRRTRLMSEKEKLITAYHEGGHALVAAALPGTDPVHKVTILPRGRALGYTMVLPDGDKYSQTRSEMLDNLAYMLGGMAAEALIFHDVTTRCRQRHREGDQPGPRDGHAVRHDRAPRRGQARRQQLRAVPGPRHGPPAQLLRGGRRGGRRGGQEAARHAHQEAFDILERNRDVLDALVLELLDKETLDKAEIAEIFEPLRLQPGAPGVDRLARPGPVDDPAGRDPAGDPRPRARRCGRPGGGDPQGGVILTPPGRRRRHPRRVRRLRTRTPRPRRRPDAP